MAATSPHEEWRKQASVTLMKTVEREGGTGEGKEPLSGVLIAKFLIPKAQGKHRLRTRGILAYVHIQISLTAKLKLASLVVNSVKLDLNCI